MKKILAILFIITMVLSVSGCKNSDNQTPTFSDKETVSETQSETTDEAKGSFSLVAGIWQISESTLDGKKINVEKYKNILTYLYNDGSVTVKSEQGKDSNGTYTFNGNMLITNINNITSVMTVSEDYTVMTATGMSDGKKVVTTYKKISN